MKQGNKMKITKRQLRRIIREARARILSEQTNTLKEADLAKSDEYYDAIAESLFAVNMGGPVPPEEIPYAVQALREMADELESEL